MPNLLIRTPTSAFRNRHIRIPHSAIPNREVLVTCGDITNQKVEAIVNAANSTLLGGGGVDGAIHRTAGAALLAECQELRRTLYPHGLPTGKAVITRGGNLPARHVIHTVGPVWGQHNGREAELLADCYRNSLQLAATHNLQSIAFPAISTGAFGYPRMEAAIVASTAIKNFLKQDSSLKEVRLVFFSASDMKMFLKHQQFDKTGDRPEKTGDRRQETE